MIMRNRRKSRLLFLIIAILSLIPIWSSPTHAVELKDIRISEYKGFTRIVFELDQIIPKPNIDVRGAGQILVTFKNAKLNLQRKIPVERSPHVKEIRFWQGKSSISALALVDYQRIRIEPFRLSRPPRFAVDLFPLKGAVTEKAGKQTPVSGVTRKEGNPIPAGGETPQISERSPDDKSKHPSPTKATVPPQKKKSKSIRPIKR